MRDEKTLSREIDPFYARVAGMVRRMAISLTTKALWQLLGHKMPDGQEVFTAEVFPGVGFFARPPLTGKPEAIVVNVGDANTPVIIATRDEKTRAAVVGAIKANESAMFNDKSLFIIKDDGTLEARAKNGVAVALATKADLDAVVTYLKKQFDAAAGHTHSAAGSGPPVEGLGGIGAGTCPAPAGTTKLKGE